MSTPVTDRAVRTAVKVPALTIAFWVVKVLTTGMGETASDHLATTYDPVLVVGLTGVVLAALLAVQMATRRYRLWLYWATVAMVSVFGTMAADVTHIVLGVPYAVSTVTFAVVVAVILAVWHRSERTLDIHSISTVRREALYWATVLATFALGTAAGDLTATTLRLGYLGSGVLFAVAIAVPFVAHRWWGMNPVLAFWIAYVLTRPLGASFADWIGVSAQRGGLGAGTGTITLILLALIVVAVALMPRSTNSR